MIRLKATTTIVSSENIAKIYWDKIWKIHRKSQKVLSNSGLQFALKFIKDLTRVLGTKRTLFTAYHSQMDSQTERINQDIEAFL